MKNLKKILLLLILIQTVLLTNILGQDTTTKGVFVPTIPARSIIKDLIVGDAAKIEILKKDIIILKKDSIIYKKDSIISLKSSQLNDYVFISGQKDGIIGEQKLIIKKTTSQLKWSKTKTTISQLGLLVLAVFTIIKIK